MSGMPEAVTRAVRKKGCSVKFRKIHRKTPVPESLFIIKLQPATLLKKKLWHRRFPVNFAKFLRTPFFTDHFWATASEMP